MHGNQVSTKLRHNHFIEPLTMDPGSKNIDPSSGDDEIYVIDQNDLALDDKAQRMMEFHANRSYDRLWTRGRVLLLLLIWDLRVTFMERLKRAFDILIAGITLPFVSPILLITAIVVKLDSPGPVFFKQERVGKWGERFHCYKFRSMCLDAEQRKAELMDSNEADEVIFKIKEDPRITWSGRIIRKLSIDEIPQLINVLKGEMSLVGPRPPVPIEVIQYTYDQFKRLEAVPGITGLQQVSGRSDLEFKRWIELDLEYIHNRSVRQDLLILLKTIPTVLSRKGAY